MGSMFGLVLIKRALKDFDAKRILNHPLTGVFVGFCLTGVLGSYFSETITNKSKEIEQFRAEEALQRQAMSDMSRRIYERRERAAMLRSALKRGAQATEIIQRKMSYDNSVVEWNANLQTSIFVMRDIMGEEAYVEIKHVLENSLAGKIFRPLDACLTQAFDLHMHEASGSSVKKLEECNSDKLFDDLVSCGFVIADQMHRMANRSSNEISDDAKQRVAQEIATNCP
jgi:hypothetical protein